MQHNNDLSLSLSLSQRQERAPEDAPEICRVSGGADETQRAQQEAGADAGTHR